MVEYREVETYTAENGEERIRGIGVITNENHIVDHDGLDPHRKIGRVVEDNGDTVTVALY